MPKPKQLVLEGMPELPPIGLAASEYLNTKDALNAAKEALNEAKEKLVIEFQKEDITSLKIAGHIISYRHNESDMITAKEG